MRHVALLACGLFAGSLIAAPVPKAVKSHPSLDGTWQVVAWYQDDVRLPLEDDRWTIDGETLTVAGPNYSKLLTHSLKRPEGGADNALDYAISHDDGTIHSSMRAVFELDGDTFKICLGDDRKARPTECKPVKGTTTLVFKRVKGERKDK